MPARVTIATIMREHGETGVQTHFNAVRAWLMTQGVPVQVLTPFSAPRSVVYPVFGLRRLVDRVHSGASVWWYRHWHYLFLREVLRRRLRDGTGTVYAQCPLSAKAALEARASPAQRVVLVVHFNLSQAHEFAAKGEIRAGGAYYRRIRRLEAEVLPRVDGIVYVSRFMRDTLEGQIPDVSRVPSAVIPNFVSAPLEAEAPAPPRRDLISIGTLEPRKNQGYLLHVLAAAKRSGGRYTLTLVGDGPDRRRLERLAAELGVAEQVAFAGFRAGAAGLLREHRAYCHSALMENLPLTLVEALAHGLPILASPVGGIPEIFSDGVEGRYWPLENPQAGAEALAALLDDAGAYDAAARAARARFDAGFEASRLAARLAAFLMAPSSPMASAEAA